MSEAGLEPARPFSQSLAPQASASANSATPTCHCAFASAFAQGIVCTTLPSGASPNFGFFSRQCSRAPRGDHASCGLSMGVDRSRRFCRENRRSASPLSEAWTSAVTLPAQNVGIRPRKKCGLLPTYPSRKPSGSVPSSGSVDRKRHFCRENRRLASTYQPPATPQRTGRR